MAMTEITRNGITTLENWLTEVESVITHDERHEFTLWSDGSISIDSLLIEGQDAEHVSLDIAALCQLRDFLLSRKITETLAKA